MWNYQYASIYWAKNSHCILQQGSLLPVSSVFEAASAELGVPKGVINPFVNIFTLLPKWGDF